MDQQGLRADLSLHPELMNGQIDFVASSEYMSRPPQPPTYMFVMEVTQIAVTSGLVEIACQSIRSLIDNLPGIPRTQVGIITFDRSINYFKFGKDKTIGEMIITSDLEAEDSFIPNSDDIIVNLSDNLQSILTTLDNLPQCVAENRNCESCFGSVLNGIYKIMENIGGRVVSFVTQLPTLGQGKLRIRENPMMLGNDKERMLFNREEDFYLKLGELYQNRHLSLVLFACPQQYIDICTLNDMIKTTNGQLFYYQNFYGLIDAQKLSTDISHVFLKETGWEGVFKIRTTKGLRVSRWESQGIAKTSDVIGTPNIDSDTTFNVEFEFEPEQQLISNIVVIQCALLYTTSEGVRSIRVFSYGMEVSSIFEDIFNALQLDVIVDNMVKKCKYLK